MRTLGRFWNWVDGPKISVLAMFVRLVLAFAIFLIAGIGFLWLVTL